MFILYQFLLKGELVWVYSTKAGDALCHSDSNFPRISLMSNGFVYELTSDFSYLTELTGMSHNRHMFIFRHQFN